MEIICNITTIGRRLHNNRACLCQFSIYIKSHFEMCVHAFICYLFGWPVVVPQWKFKKISNLLSCCLISWRLGCRKRSKTIFMDVANVVILRFFSPYFLFCCFNKNVFVVLDSEKKTDTFHRVRAS